MAFDGNGNWISDFSAVADRDANIKILASRFDNIFIADIATSFENCLTKDGQVKTQTNFNANNYRVINVADPSDGKDAVNKQTLEGGNITTTGDWAFSGELTAVTPTSATDNTTAVATTEWVNNHLADSSVVVDMVGNAMPNYSSSVSKSDNVSYTADSNGYIIWQPLITRGYNKYTLTIDGKAIGYGGNDDWTNNCLRAVYPIKKGKTYSSNGSSYFAFAPAVGG